MILLLLDKSLKILSCCFRKLVWYLLLTSTDDLLAFVSLHVLINLELLYCLSCIWTEATSLPFAVIVYSINVPISNLIIDFELVRVICNNIINRNRVKRKFLEYYHIYIAYLKLKYFSIASFYVDEFMWQQKIVSNLKAGDKLSNNKNKTWDDCFHIQMRKRKHENRNAFVIEYWIRNMN